jgi:hypothetical protein
MIAGTWPSRNPRHSYHQKVRHLPTLIAIGLAAPLLGQSPVYQRISEHLRADDLKADVSFLASDALEGRGTPSRGLDLAAEFIASQFRRAGLEPAGDDGYFQTATFFQVTPSTDPVEFTFDGAAVPKSAITVQDAAAVQIAGASAFRATAAELEGLTADQVRGKVLLVDPGDGGFQAMRRVPAQVAKLEPVLVVLVRSEGPAGPGGMRGPRVPLRDTQPRIAILNIADPALRDAIAVAKTGPIEMKVSAHVPAPKVETVKVRNIAAVIRGTDPTLKDTYLVVTGHYDHLGINPNLEGDKIFNGANDDASGSSSVVEIAAALQALPEKPKRTIVFVTVFGEEVGGLGARWYTGHPIFPLGRTIADINLEQLGRTDDNEGPKPLQFNLTGFDYTDIAATFAKLTPQTDIRVVKHEKNSDAFFGRSDNATFADAGIPSTTISVSYVYPDYHKVSDEWPKLDYDNMARVDRAIALGVWTMANDPQAPKWNKDNPKTARYIAQPR